MAAVKTSRLATSAKPRAAKKEPVRIQTTVLKSKREAPKAVSKISAEELERRIRDRAYFLYLNRGQTDGQECNDWAAAEQQIKRELNIR
jgi:hypothetical protein